MFCAKKFLGMRVGFLALLGSVGLAACSSGSDFNKQAILDSVDSALTVGDCTAAVATIQPLYQSIESDNSVRLKAASAYGCHARINFFKLIGDLAGSDIVTGSQLTDQASGLWRVLAKVFPSQLGSDYVVEGGLNATDALQAALIPGALIQPVYQVNSGSHNVGSVLRSDRISDANIYLTFVAMATIGGLENRYGNPNPLDPAKPYVNTGYLSWTTPNAMNEQGCALASSMLNLVDAMAASGQAIGGSLGSGFTAVADALGLAFDVACAAGCAGTNQAALSAINVPTSPPISFLKNGRTWTASGCSTSCSGCPVELRDRTRCSQGDKGVSTCAAVGLINFLNASTIGWN